MFVNGYHRVAELRERSASKVTESGIEVWLDAQTEGSSAIVVSFTDRKDHDIQLIRSRPTPVIQFARPRAEAQDFLRTFPPGSLVVSNFTQPTGKPASLRITRYEDDAPSLRAVDLSDIVPGKSGGEKSKPVKPLAVDPDIIGTWESGGRHYDIRADGSYLIRDVQAYELRDSGATLYWAPMTFSRLSGAPAEVAGHWLSSGLDEDVLLRSDDTYVWHTVGSFPDALGEWLLDGSNLISWELRAHISTDDSDIHMDAVFSGTYSGSYALNGDKTQLTMQFGGITVVYTKV